ncbi:MAG TPA: hypothetical protein VIJ47_07735, partial [Acidimicrobiales bacterium]
GLLPLIQGALDGFDDIVDGDIEIDDDGVTVVRLARDPARAHGKWNGPVRGTMMQLTADDPGAPSRLVVTRPASCRVLVRVADVPGLGWRRAGAGGTPLTVDPVTATADRLANGLVTVQVDATDATFAIDGLTGFGRLVDDGDGGDTYNYSPPAGDRTVDRPDAVAVSVLEEGPLRGRVQIVATYRWPERITDGARTGERAVEVTTTLELQAGERLVRVTTSFDNTCRDHRLRAWLPLPAPAETSRAECAFAEVTRGLHGEGGPTERAMATFPSRRFVQAGGLTVVHEGLLEYELVELTGSGGEERAHALALTLLRSTGMLSQGPMAYRPLPAGPTIAMEGPQMAGPLTVRYAVQTGDADPYALVDDAFLPLLVADPTTIAGMAATPPTEAESGQRFAVHGAEVSAVTRTGGKVQVRVWNPSDTSTEVLLDGQRGWLVDLRGHPVGPFEGGFELGPWRIATAVLDT